MFRVCWSTDVGFVVFGLFRDGDTLSIPILVQHVPLESHLPNPDAPCMEYLPTFALKVTQFCW